MPLLLIHVHRLSSCPRIPQMSLQMIFSSRAVNQDPHPCFYLSSDFIPETSGLPLKSKVYEILISIKDEESFIYFYFFLFLVERS